MLFMVLLAATGYAQYTFSGTVTTTSSAPVAGQTVYVESDSALWTGSMSPMFHLSAVTNSSGAYSVTLPSSITSGHPILAYTLNCSSGPSLYNSHTYAGVNITSNFVKCVPPPPPVVSGTITAGSSGAANAKVFLIDKFPDSVWVGSTLVSTMTLQVRDSGLTNSAGNYSINTPSLVRGSLLVKAFLTPAASNYSSYLPTYYTSSLIWSGATAVSSTSSVTVNIALTPGTNPGGPGFIGGYVIFGANKTTAVGDPSPGRQIILTDNANNAIAYAISDASGHFMFNNLAYGTYKIFGDVLGKNSTPLSVTINATTPGISIVKFEDKVLTFNASLATSVGSVSAALKDIRVYPNPVNNVLNIAGLENIKGDKDALLTDITGKQIGNYHFTNMAETAINVSALPAGIYILQLATTEGTATFKVSK